MKNKILINNLCISIIGIVNEIHRKYLRSHIFGVILEHQYFMFSQDRSNKMISITIEK